MIKVFCDKCEKDCDLIAYAIKVELIHNPCPVHPLDKGDLKITCDRSQMRMCLCQECYRKLGFPNIYEVQRTKQLRWRDHLTPESCDEDDDKDVLIL